MSARHVEAELVAFGRRVRDERLYRGMSLAACAALIPSTRLGELGHMSDAMLGAIERGQRRPTLAHALAIAGALEVSLSDLLSEPEPAERHCTACTTDAGHARRHRELSAVSA